MSKKSKPGSRWNAGNQRYTAPDELAILRKYREPEGWRQGARVTRRGK